MQKAGVQPLRIRRFKHLLAYLVYLQGYSSLHPIKYALQDYWEHNQSNFVSWNAKPEIIGQNNIKFSSSVPSSVIPP